jgi:membrane protease YdiL (CAAX protease family)
MAEVAIAMAAFLAYKWAKDLPFNYITQTDYDLCTWLNGSFCSRIASTVAAVLVYTLYLQSSRVVQKPVKNALRDPLLPGLDGAFIGAGIMGLSIVANIVFGFIELKGIDYGKLTIFPLVGMLMTGFTEELIYRALPINALRSYLSDDVLVGLTALLFGYIHSQSVYYGISAALFGLLTGYGFLKYGLYWAAALHAASNTVETLFYSIVKYKVKNPIMAGLRSTPDDDGTTTTLIQLLALFGLKYVGYL